MTEGDLTIAGRTDPAATAPRQTERTNFHASAATRRLVVISNRVTPTGGARPDSGGLAVAIRAALQQSGGMWFGWSGEVSDEDGEPAIVADGPLTFATLDLSQKDFNEYYTGFSNRVLWPLFHFRSSLVEFSRRYLSGYLRVNRMFARVLAPMLSPGPRLGPRLSSDPPRRRASEAGSIACDRIFPAHPLSAGRIASGAAEPPGCRKVALCL